MTIGEQREALEDVRLDKPKNLRVRVYDTVRNRIQAGLIAQDERIVDLELAALLGISRMPVREALMQLVHEGALESTSRGFTLRTFSDQEVEDIFEIRCLLEPPAAASAAGNMGIAALHKLETALHQCEATSEANNVHGFIISNADFRSTWLAQVSNRHLSSTIARFADQVQAIRLATLQTKAVRADAIERMWTLCEAFRAKSAQDAASRTKKQILAALGAFRRYRRAKAGM